MVCLPVAQGPVVDGEAFGTSETMSSSIRMSATDLHPVPGFVRLVYRVLNGSEVAAAAQYTPNAYVAAVTLSHTSNNLLRDLLCRQKPWPTVVSILKDLCTNEGVPWRSGPGATARASTVKDNTGSTTGASETARIPVDGKTATDSSITATARASDSLPSEPAVVVVAKPAGKHVASSNGTPNGFSSSGVALSEKEKQCEVISPGLVRSPYDPKKSEQAVSPEEWVCHGRVCCQVTQQYFRLPRRLDPLIAQVVAPGVIQSPYATPGAVQRILWDEWVPGREIVCTETAKRITLPMDLPLPVAAADSQGQRCGHQPLRPNDAGLDRRGAVGIRD